VVPESWWDAIGFKSVDGYFLYDIVNQQTRHCVLHPLSKHGCVVELLVCNSIL
jgi:hypothetical protein